MTEPATSFGVNLEPVRLSVSDVRRAIYAASGFASGDGHASTDLLGSLFHRGFWLLLDPSSDQCWSNLLGPDGLEDHGRLRDEVYQNLIGPALSRHAATLDSSSVEVLAMWEATQHLCKYVCQLLLNCRERGLLRFDFGKAEWVGEIQFAPEQELSWVVHESGWTAPVKVSGIADAVWRRSGQRWWILELKLGTGSAAADLAQLCLYHEMLRHTSVSSAGQISLLHFQPELKIDSFSEEQIAPVKPALRALIGRLAGVTGTESEQTVPSAAHRELGTRLVEVLKQFGPLVTLDSDPVVGPSFLRFHIKPGPGVKVNRILPLGEDLRVQLRLHKPALISLEGGSVVVDLEREDREMLLFQEFRNRLPDRPAETSAKGNAKLLVGVDLNREPRFADLSSSCPHILAAGTTGSGKSEWLLTAIASLIATNTPATLRLLLIDPKRVTFRELQDSPFLLYEGAVLVSPEEALAGLEMLVDMMDERYRRLEKHGVADLEALCAKLPDATLPRIVCFCDEYGNLVADRKHREAIEPRICQIGAKARAAGIHLVVATQDPRAAILPPALKSNLDGRVCLRTATSIQSRMILEETGGEALLGQGDLLFRAIGDRVRLQAPLLSDTDRADLFGRK